MSEKARRRHIGLWLLGLLLLVGLGGLLALKQAYPPERIHALVGEQVKAATGREFSIRGPLSWRLFPNIAVVVEDVHLANLPWGTRADMVRVRKAALELALKPLLKGEFEVQRLTVEGADIWLEVDEQGRGNWAFKAAQTPTAANTPAGDAEPAALSLGLVQWLDSRVTLHSPRIAKDQTLLITELNLRERQAEFALDAKLDVNGLPIKVDGIFGGLAVLRSKSEAWPVDLKLSATGLQLSAQGQLSLGAHAGDFELALNAKLQSTQALASLLAKPEAKALLQALPLPLQLSAQVRRQDAKLALNPFKLTLAGQVLDGELTEDGSNPLNLRVRLNADDLDLAAWLPKSSAEPKTPKPPGPQTGPLFSPERWPLPSRLPLNLDLTLAIKQLHLPGSPALADLQAHLSAGAQGVELHNASWLMAGGPLRASARLDLADKKTPPRWQLKLDGKELAVDGLGALLTSAPFKGGQLRLALDLAALGDSAHSLASSLDGQVLIDGRNMHLQGRAAGLGTDLLAGTLHALTPGAAPNRDNLIHCAIVRLPFRQGLAEIDRSVALESEQFSVAVLGRVDLGEETIALALRPFTQKGLGVSAANLSGLAKLEGPLRKPQLSLDVAGSAREATQLGLKIATGGLSVLAERTLLKPEPGEQPCQRALKPSSSADNNKAKPANKAGKSLLNSLFGR